jgi:hypothetical protein
LIEDFSAMLPSHETLRIADEDARTVYRDLSSFRIALQLAADGWHVDYDVASPLTAGGGPRYVIDPRDGRIISKRYEQ